MTAPITNMASREGEPINFPQPLPLMPDYPEIAAYPVEALDRSGLGAVVRAIQGMTQAPMAIPAQSALSAAALAVQGFADVETLGGKRPLSLYCLTVATSGERKSSCDKPVMSPVLEYEKEQNKANIAVQQLWQNAKDVWDERAAGIKSKIKRGQAGVDELNALGPAPVAPPSTDRLVTEPTWEGLTKLFAQGQPSLGLFSDEGGQFLGGHAMSKDNAQKTLAALNNLWMAEPIKRTRSGDGSITLYGRRLSLHLMIQPVVARSFLADPLADGTGFLPRCLMCEPPTTIGTRFHAGAKTNDAALTAFAMQMRNKLLMSMPADPETRALEPPTLSLSASARELLIKYSDEVEAAQAPKGKYEHLRGHASKSAEQAARMAGVLTLWQNMAAKEVEFRDMMDAIKLAQFYLGEVARLTEIAAISQETMNAEKLREWLLQSGKIEIDARSIQRLGPNALRNSKVAREAAIAMLVDHNWLFPLDLEKRWRINRI